MKQLKDKEEGLYFEIYGDLVTEREYIKEWSSEIIENSAIADIDDFYEKYGYDHDLDDNEVYEGFLHYFDYQVEKNREQFFTVALDPTDLQKSIITTRFSKEKIKFEDLNFGNTEQVLKALDIKRFIKEPSLSDLMDELEDDEYDYAENNVQDYLIYIDKNELVVKSSESNTPFTLKEFIEYNSDRLKHSPDGIDKDLVQATRDLYTAEKISENLLLNFGAKDLINTSNVKTINIDKSTDQYALFEMKYADSNKIMNEDTFYIMEDIVYTGLTKSKKRDYLYFKYTLQDDEMTLDGTNFTDYVLEQHSNSPKRKYNDINKLQNDLAIELNETHPQYRVLKMHNNEENRTLSEQVETLSNNALRLGDCDYEEGYLVNHQNMLAFVIPEKNLEQKALFEDAQSKFNFSSDKITFQFKDSEGDIDYLVREKHQKGIVELKGQYYQVFEKKPDAHGDATTAVFLKVEEDFALQKICEIEEEKLESVYGVKLDDMKFESGQVVADFKVPKFDYMFVITHNKQKDEMLFDDISVFEDAVDSANPDSNPSDQDLYSSLTNLVEAKSKLNHKSLSNDEMDRKIKAEELTIDAPRKKNTSSLRM